VVSGSLCCNNYVEVMSMFSVISVFTYRSFMSIVISLCLLLMLSFIRSCARVTEFSTVYWLPRFRRCCKILLSFLAPLYEGACMLLITGVIGLPSL